MEAKKALKHRNSQSDPRESGQSTSSVCYSSIHRKQLSGENCRKLNTPAHSLGQWLGIIQHLPAMDAAKVIGRGKSGDTSTEPYVPWGSIRKMPELQHWESSDEIESSRGSKGQCQKTEEHGSVNISECT